MINSTQVLGTGDHHHHNQHNHSLNAILNNLSSKTSSHWHRQLSKKKIKAPDSLKSPLAPWQEPVENWKALVTEDVFSAAVELSSSTSPTTTTTTTNKMPSRRHTMTFTDLNRLSSTLASLNIFSSGNRNKKATAAAVTCNKQQLEMSTMAENDEEEEVSRLKWKMAIAKSRLTQPVYFKHGPGYDDFGFVSTNELTKVRRTNLTLVCVVSVSGCCLALTCPLFISDLHAVILYLSMI